MKFESVKTENNKRVFVVKNGKKTFKRISWKETTNLGPTERFEWRRFKTNHLVKQDERKELEQMFKEASSLTQDYESKKDAIYSGTASIDFDALTGEIGINQSGDAGIGIGTTTSHHLRQIRTIGEPMPIYYERHNIRTISEADDFWKERIKKSGIKVKKLQRIRKEILRLVNQGSKLASVKYAKEQMKWGLKDSKDYVEHLILKNRKKK